MLVTKAKKWIAIPLLLLLTACGASFREKTIRLTFEGVQATQAGFLAYVERKGSRIIDEAKQAGKPLEQAKAELDAFFAKVDPIHLAIQSAMSALILVTLEPKAEHLTEAIGAAKRLYDLYRKLEK